MKDMLTIKVMIDALFLLGVLTCGASGVQVMSRKRPMAEMLAGAVGAVMIIVAIFLQDVIR